MTTNWWLVKRGTAPFALVTLVVAIPWPAPTPAAAAPLAALPAAPAGDAQQAILAAYRAQDAAYARKDFSGYLAAFADDFVELTQNGLENTAQKRQRLAPIFADPDPVTLRTTVQELSVSPAGDTATARVKRTATFSVEDLFTPGRITRAEQVGIEWDTWTKTPIGWRLRRRREPPLVRELGRMYAEDQAARTRTDLPPKEQGALMSATDARNRARLKMLIRDFGWPSKSLVGSAGVDAAWAIAQHSDLDVPFQQQALALLADAVKRGEAEPNQLAYLTDRVLVNTGKKQIYGTQMMAAPNGDLAPRPIADPANVDERRASVGLGPLRDYVTFMRAQPKPGQAAAAPPTGK